MDSYCVVCSVITYVAAQLIHFLYIFFHGSQVYVHKMGWKTI